MSPESLRLRSRAPQLAQCISWSLLCVFSACSPGSSAVDLIEPLDASHTQIDPSVSPDAAQSSPGVDAAPSSNPVDAGRDAAPTSLVDASPSQPANDAAAEAATPATLDATTDASRAQDASTDAAATSTTEEAGARAPMFKKTRCIDPSKLKADSELNFPCDGVDVWVVVPAQCMKQACGLLFNIHGGGMSDHATMDQATNMIALGSRADYIVVHPHKGTWSVASDKNLVFGFMQQAIEAFDVDKKRVHSTGYSQGGQISWAIGCEHADVIASIAPAEEINRVSDCWKTSKLPARELPVLFAYGKQDSIGGGYAAAEDTVKQFVAAHRMMGPQTIAGTETSKYWRQRWTSSTGGVLEFIAQDYTSSGVLGILAGHCLPMAMGKTFVSCSLPVDYDWGEEVVRFFRAHPMP